MAMKDVRIVTRGEGYKWVEVISFVSDEERIARQGVRLEKRWHHIASQR
uniref:Uncharacterized protein n=1 Tax=Nelumbo nucifera TaxID=4432 RepID=A0A822Y1K7_NELNU|nr:TPA_asm: hypothetical protein HUJ06_026855 [Nelumbo nucifera]